MDEDFENIAHVEHIVSGAVFVVGAVWWLLSACGDARGVAVLVVYVATFAIIRAWRLSRERKR